MSRWLPQVLLVAAAGGILASCPSPTAPPPPREPATLSGLAYDSVTGDAVSGALIRFGGESARTAADGSFEILLGEGDAVVVAAWLVFEEGYEFTYVNRLAVDPGHDGPLFLPMRKSGLSSYPAAAALEGAVAFADGSPVPDGSTYTLEVHGCDGTWSQHQGALSANRYAVSTAVDCPDCLVILRVQPAAGEAFSALARHVDLSGPLPVELGFQQPDDGFLALEIAAEKAGNRGACYILSPYGPIPGQFLGAGEMREDWVFAGSDPENVLVYNPFGWTEAVWIQREQDEAFAGLPQHRKVFQSCSAVTELAGPVALPAIDHERGPTAGADPGCLNLSCTGLGLDPVQGACLYRFVLTADDPEGARLGTVIAVAPFPEEVAVALPVELAAALSGQCVCVSFDVVDAGVTALSPTMLPGAGTPPPELAVGVVEGVGPAEYARTFVLEPGTVVIGIE